ncbi:CLUMA_CG009548, isoform A, partial [Clunio marinus]
ISSTLFRRNKNVLFIASCRLIFTEREQKVYLITVSSRFLWANIVAKFDMDHKTKFNHKRLIIILLITQKIFSEVEFIKFIN